MKIAVFGAGAVGGYFGARLAEAGHDVAFVARGRTLEALRREGLRVESPEGDVHLASVAATDDPASIGAVDWVLLGVKAWQVEDAAAACPPLLGPETPILPVQNGVDAPSDIARAAGEAHAIGGVCRIIAALDGPGVVTHMGADPTILVGELDDRASDRVDGIVASFDGTVGTTVTRAESIRVEMWKKLTFLASTSAVGATARVPFGEMRGTEETRDLLHRLMREIVSVAHGAGVPVPDAFPDGALAFVDSLPESSTSSFQRDIAAGRPSELEAQLGALRRIGRETGTPTPIADVLYAVLLPLERRARAGS